MSVFVDHLAGVGKSLEGSVKRYNEAVGSLESRVLPAARRLRELGVGAADIDSPSHVELQARSASAIAVEKAKDLPDSQSAKVVRLPEN
jgi:DNA recombination protein RmuC